MYVWGEMNRKPAIEELEEGTGYEKVITIPYGEIAPFVMANIFRPAAPVMIVWVLTALSLLLSVLLWPGLITPAEGYGIIAGLVTGLVFLPALLIPVHEGLHIIPYALAGARDIRVGADLRQGIVYVTAHRFVAGKRLFRVVAITPLVTITAILVLLMLLTGAWWRWVLALTIMTHSLMCAGDAAMLAALTRYRRREIYTWDDADREEAYFYVSSGNGESST